MSDIKEIEKHIENLRKKINKLNDDYYNRNASLVDDSIFDSFLKELFKLEEQYPQFKTSNSPTNNVGTKLSSNFQKVQHKVKMLSLKNAFNRDDLNHFNKQIKDIFNDFNYFVEPKIDGLSISLEYKEGKLFKALTRGDGITGEDVTNNIRQISDIPLAIDLLENIEVRGEIYLPISQFKIINKKRLNKDLPLFANPRNAASGTLRQLNSNIVKERKLSSFFYWAFNLQTKKYNWNTQKETIENLNKLNFKTSSLSKYVHNIDEVYNHIQFILNEKKKQNYEIDGVVIKVNNSKLYDEIGETSKFPKWSIAYKFPAKTTETKLIDIFPTVGRTGRITYNAKLEPIKLDGTTVQRATLHNADYIKDLDLRIGDYVNIKKAGEIIPKVISMNINKRTNNLNKWIENKYCPSCNSKLERLENEVDQYCFNENCQVKLIESIIHFVSRDAMNIVGFSSKQIEKFVNIGYLKDIKDIYLLKNYRKEILNLEGYQERSVNVLLDSIEKSKSNSLDRLLFGLGIRYIGKKSSKDLANNFKSLDKIISLNIEDFLNQRDLGDVKSKSIIEFFKKSKTKDLLKHLYDLGINPIQEESKLKPSKKLLNKSIVVTGTIEGGTRSEIKEILELKGAKILSSISKNVDFVICGKNPSQNKLNKISDNKIINVINIVDINNL